MEQSTGEGPEARYPRPRLARLRSAFDDDEVFRVGPEARGVRDLHGVPGELPVVVGRRVESGRVLARHDAVFLVRLRQRQLGEMAPSGRGDAPGSDIGRGPGRV